MFGAVSDHVSEDNNITKEKYNENTKMGNDGCFGHRSRRERRVGGRKRAHGADGLACGLFGKMSGRF